MIRGVILDLLHQIKIEQRIMKIVFPAKSNILFFPDTSQKIRAL